MAESEKILEQSNKTSGVTLLFYYKNNFDFLFQYELLYRNFKARISNYLFGYSIYSTILNYDKKNQLVLSLYGIYVSPPYTHTYTRLRT